MYMQTPLTRFPGDPLKIHVRSKEQSTYALHLRSDVLHILFRGFSRNPRLGPLNQVFHQHGFYHTCLTKGHRDHWSHGQSRPCVQSITLADKPQGGIGYDLAERLHARGYNVAITGRRVKDGEAFATTLDEKGETALFVECHVEDYDSQTHLFRTVWQKWKRLDCLIANAGIVDVGSRYNLARRDASVDDVPPRPDLSCTDVDFKAVVYGTELAVHYMRHNPGGSSGKIIVTGSVAGIYPVTLLPEYSAIKAAALQWVRVMAPMLGKENITINNVLPNAYNTGIMPNFEEAYLDEQ